MPELDDIETIAILVQLSVGSAHQVLSTPENKKLMVQLLAQMDSGLKLSYELEPIQLITKPKAPRLIK